jgi:small-conductance mechanosensitive channel
MTVEPVVAALGAHGAVVAMAVPGSVGQLSAGIVLVVVLVWGVGLSGRVRG